MNYSKSTLIIEPTITCSECRCCPRAYREDVNVSLSPLVLSKIKELLGGYKFDEAIITCPQNVNDERFQEIINIVNDLAEKTILFISTSTLRNIHTRLILDKVDELVITSCTLTSSALQDKFIEVLQSSGFENISLYWIINALNVNYLVTIIDYCMKRQIKLRIGPSIYGEACNLDVEKVMENINVRIGCIFGILYGYIARRAYYDNFPLTILTKPCNLGYSCRKLYIRPPGFVSKCPLLGNKGKYIDEVASIDLTKIIFSECPFINNNRERLLKLTPKVAIEVLVNNNTIVDEKTLELLEIIDYTKSIRSASLVLGIHPSTAVKKIKELEAKLGVRIVRTRRGGVDRGGTELTSEGKKLVNLYRRIKKSIIEATSTGFTE